MGVGGHGYTFVCKSSGHITEPFCTEVLVYDPQVLILGTKESKYVPVIHPHTMAVHRQIIQMYSSDGSYDFFTYIYDKLVVSHMLILNSATHSMFMGFLSHFIIHR